MFFKLTANKKRLRKQELNMTKFYYGYFKTYAVGLGLMALISSCSKETAPTPSGVQPIATLGLYEKDSSVYKSVYIPISRVGTQSSATYYSIFDTGSSGMTIDAYGLIPAAMTTSSGIQVAGDSVNVNGITITNKTAILFYGNSLNERNEYGNLAYAQITIGDRNGSITTRRIPFFLYYKVVNVATGIIQQPHSNDIFGVGPGCSFASNAIASPLSYFTTGNGVVSGFKLAKFSNAGFSLNGTYVRNLLTIGLVPDDLSSSSGFIMHPLTFYPYGGYSPDIAATVTYNNTTTLAAVLFDTGASAVSIIESTNPPPNLKSLPPNTNVTINTVSGFSYSYTTAAADDLTQVDDPSNTGDPRTIFSIDFFTENQYLINYDTHQLGLKKD